MKKDREIYTIGIVLLGNFNPSIITPFWLAHKGYIREIEANTAIVEIIHPNISRFSISDWLNIEATQQRIDFKTNRESHISVLRDLVVSVFNNLNETPIQAIGINHLSHFSLRNLDEYERLGYWLSPVQKFGSLLNKPKLQSIQFRETVDEKKEGQITLTISPSDLILDRKSVVFNINHHFDSKDKNTAQIIEILVKNWENSFSLVNKLNDLVWEKAQL